MTLNQPTTIIISVPYDKLSWYEVQANRDALRDKVGKLVAEDLQIPLEKVKVVFEIKSPLWQR